MSTSSPTATNQPRRAVVASVALLFTAGAIAACGEGGSGASGELTTTTASSVPEAAYEDLTASSAVTIDAVDNQFKPQYATVRVGTAVTFRNDGRSVHNVLPVTEGAFPPIEAVDFEPDDQVTITLREPGLVPYYCSLHGTTTKGMVGGLRVVE